MLHILMTFAILVMFRDCNKVTANWLGATLLAYEMCEKLIITLCKCGVTVITCQKYYDIIFEILF